MDDISQASLLELIAGKNRSSVIAAVLQNGKILDEALEDAGNSTGSAAKENEKYLDSIQGKVDQFTNSLQTMWSHFLESDTIKDFIDFGTTVIKTIDEMGAGWTIFTGLVLASVGKITGSGLVEWFTKLGTDEQITLGDGLSKKFKGLKKGAIDAGKALGLLKTNTAGAFAGFTKLGLGLGIAGAAITVVTALIVSHNQKLEEMRQAAAESANALDEELNSIEDYKVQISDLQEKLKDNNLSEQEAYDIRKDLLFIQDGLIKKYGEEAEGLNLITQSATEANEVLDEVAQKQAEIWLGQYAGPIDDAVAFFTSDTQGKKLGKGLNKETKITGNMTTGAVGSLLDEYDQSHKNVKQNILSMQQREISFSGSVEEVKQEVESLMTYLREQEQQFTSQLSSATGKQATALKNDIESIQTYQERLGNAYSTWFGEGSKYTDYKTTFEQYQEVLGRTKYSEAVDKIEQAQKDYQDALDAGNTDQAKVFAQNVIDATQEAINSATQNGETWMDSFFLPMQEGYDAAIKKINFQKAWTSETGDIQQAITTAVTNASEAAGHKIEDQELLNLQNYIVSETTATNLKDGTQKVVIQWDESVEISQEQKALYEQLATAALNYGYTVEELIPLLVELGVIQGSTFAAVEQTTSTFSLFSRTVSQLTSTVDKYNEAVSAASEFMTNGAIITEEYKETLTDLIDDKDALAECFDDNNALMITNIDLLNDLLKASKQNIKAETQLAKSQARLRYNNLVKQLTKTLNSTNKLDDATRDSVNSTLDQIDAVELAIDNYQRLEDSLLGATNGYQKFAEAQEIDALNTYGDTYVDMAQTMYDALYKTGKVGTEAFWASVESLIPDSVYQSITSDADKMKAIYAYFKNDILPTLTLDDDTLSMEYKNVEDFFDKGKESGVFEGTAESFDLVEGLNLEKAAQLLEMTTTQAYAFFAALDQYNVNGDGLSFIQQLDDSFDGTIAKIDHELIELNKRKMALLEDGGYDKHQKELDQINTDIATQNALLQVQQVEAHKTWQAYSQNGEAITALEAIDDKTQLLTPELAMSIGIGYAGNKDKTIQQVLDELLAQKAKLAEPTYMMASFAIEDIDSQISEIQNLLNSPHELKVQASTEGLTVRELQNQLNQELQELEEEKEVLALTFGITLDGEDQEKLMSELEEFEEFTIHDKSFKVSLSNYYTTKSRLKELKDLADKFNGVTSSNTTTPKPSNDNPLFTNEEHSAFASGTSGAPRTEEALLSETGPEIVVRNGKWFTVGQSGPTFFKVKKNDIIFDAQQSKELLTKGHTKRRGKAFASGTAFDEGLWKPTKPDSTSSNDSTEDEEDTAEQIIDFIEIKLEEIENIISQATAKVENIMDDSSRMIEKRKAYDELIAETQEKMKTNSEASKVYAKKAAELLQAVPENYREMAKNGALAIEDFIGEDQVEIAEAIEKFREYDSKADSAQLASLEAIAEISELSLQRITDIADDFDNIIGLMDAKSSLIQVNMDLADAMGYRMSEQYYEELIKGSENTIYRLQEKQKALKEDLEKAVASGEIAVGSDDWYEAVNLILECDEAIVDCKIDTEEWNNAIRDLKWDNLEYFVSELDNIESQLSNLYDLIADDEQIVDEMGNWTAEGITALGLLAQQMELAQYTAQQYGDAIKDLEANRAQYSDDEYNEKLAELIDKQWESIDAYEQAKDAIVDLNKTRVDAIKNGIQKEIDAYKELIEAKKESLNADKDAHDFEKSVAEKQKNIATIQRQLAAIAHNDSAEATAERKKLQAELLEANAELEELYYDNSIDTQLDALDKEYDAYEAHKNKEMDLLEDWLTQQEQVISESYQVVQSNTEVVFSTLNGIANEYGVQISSAITSPWQDGQNALSDYTGAFNAAIGSLSANASSFINQLNAIKQAQDNIVNSANNMANNVIQDVNNTYNEVAKDYTYVDEFGKTIADYSREYFAAKDRLDADGMQAANDAANRIRDKLGIPHQIANEDIGLVRIAAYKQAYAEARARGDADGMQAANDGANAVRATLGLAPEYATDDIAMIRKKYQGYATGTTGTKKDELAWIDEQGLEELVLHAGPDGRLQYLTKGTSVIPSNISENLIKLGSLDPQHILDQSRPQVSIPNITNNNINLDLSIAEVVHIDHADRDSVPDITQAVQTQLDKYMKNINNSLKRYAR